VERRSPWFTTFESIKARFETTGISVPTRILLTAKVKEDTHADGPFHAPGITYNGLHSTPNPTASQVSADLATTKQHFGHVRTYYPQYGGGAVDVGKLAKDAGLNLMLGLFRSMAID
jgi:exo-beta-1,3-glucanase (GH17 family)